MKAEAHDCRIVWIVVSQDVACEMNKFPNIDDAQIHWGHTDVSEFGCWIQTNALGKQVRWQLAGWWSAAFPGIPPVQKDSYYILIKEI